MHNLIFHRTEHDGQIPYAQSGDLIQALLDFDAEALEMVEVGQNPELFLLRKACELKQWPLSGEFPRFFIAQQVEVTLTRKNRGFVRILNARSHTALAPLTLDGLQQEISACLKQAQAWKTNPQTFMGQLFETWLKLRSSTSAPVPLSAVYQQLSLRSPGYKREYFGLDLNRCLNSGLIRNSTHLLSVTPATADQGQGFFVFDSGGTGQWIGQIIFLPLEN